MNDQFEKVKLPGLAEIDHEKTMEKYAEAINKATPAAEVLGITDYFSIGCYRAVKKLFDAKKLPKVKFIFPNVELRLANATEGDKAINAHLLFDPKDPDHEQQIERVLQQFLVFSTIDRKFTRSHVDLVALGRTFDSRHTEEHPAKCAGANQFKVQVSDIRDALRADKWMRENCLIAVASKSTDGTAGLQNDATFKMLRQDMEAFANVVFNSSEKTRQFWLGQHRDYDIPKLKEVYGGRKPCLHGSDAHHNERVLEPDQKRYCWVKGDPTFDSLRQCLLEPEDRVSIGEFPPSRHNSSMCIRRVECHDAAWLENQSLELNLGLVAIIGPRGSGKTALADILAIGADVFDPIEPKALEAKSSFISRAVHASNFDANSQVTVEWADDERKTNYLYPSEVPEIPEYAKGVRYLSQQFVERLCSSEGLATELREELERVIFESTERKARHAANSFADLADIHLTDTRIQRRECQEQIEGTSDEIVQEEMLINSTDQLKADVKALTDKITKRKKEMTELLPKGMGERVKRLTDLEAAIIQSNARLDGLRKIRRSIENLNSYASRMRNNAIEDALSKLKNEYRDAQLNDIEWEAFRLRFSGDVDGALVRKLSAVDGRIKSATDGDSAMPFDPNATLDKWPHQNLVDFCEVVRKEVGLDKNKHQRYEVHRLELDKEEKLLAGTNTTLEKALAAPERRKKLTDRRKSQYRDVFQTFVDEEAKLVELYGSLSKMLKDAKGTLSKMRFEVSRHIDIEGWAREGEKTLFDLRKDSRLKGQGTLLAEAKKKLLGPWKSGTADQVAEAMQTFIQEMYSEFRKAILGSELPNDIAKWKQKVAAWLYGTEHISMSYCVTYNGVSIEHLSPGTRGIVLLLLYLVIDKQDQRPLIIDQPEENLDPQSVFEELVSHFREARKRRQVIVVTHNANLVVNTDADQVIVASSTPHEGSGLPKVSYYCGALEDQSIREMVCNILEGGKEAFRDRERRYRLDRARDLE